MIDDQYDNSLKKIKVIYTDFIIDGENIIPIPNGLHPKIVDLIKEKYNLSQNLYKAMDEVNHLISPYFLPFDHIHFGPYLQRHGDYVTLNDVNIESDYAYIWLLEIKRTLYSISNLKLFQLNNKNFSYNLQDIIPDHLSNLLAMGRVKVVITIMQDPIPVEEIYYLEQYFENTVRIDPKHIIFVPGNDCMDEYKRKYPESRMKLSHAELLLLKEFASSINQLPRPVSLGYIADVVRESDLNENQMRKYKFLSLNRTLKPHRYIIAYHAVKNNMLSNNLYSFLNPRSDNYEGIANLISQFVDEDDKLEISKKIFEIIPYQLDTHNVTKEQRSSMSYDCMQKEIYQETYINIVTESSYSEITKTWVSEKIWKPIINLQPFIIVGPYQTLEFIKKLGFKTFVPFINEDYDNIFDHKLRMNAILKEIDRLNDMTISDIHKWYYSIKEILIHNKNLLTKMDKIDPFETLIKDILKTNSSV